MSVVSERYVVAPNLSIGWLDAVGLLDAAPNRKVVHLIVRIADPTQEDLEIRRSAQDLIDIYNESHQRRFNDIATTRNTIFPQAWAKRFPEPCDLAEHYRLRYTRDQLRGFSENARGTYFGRIVAYPRPGSTDVDDQLTDTVRKLRDETATHAPKSSRYEINIYSEALDHNPMSFPCLAHLSVHLHEQRLHMQAIYRNETFVSRAYGNFLGLAQLQCYVATATKVLPGELLVTVGHAELDGTRRPIRSMLRGHETHD